MEESLSFRSSLLTLRLATLPALSSIKGNYSAAVEKSCRETYYQASNEYCMGLYKAILDWVAGPEMFRGDEERGQVFEIARHDRLACCGHDFGEARRMSEMQYFDQNLGDTFESLRHKPTPTRGRALTRQYPRSRASSQPITMTERYDAAARSRTTGLP